jgi:UDP-glucose 4-epimerase
MLYIDIVDVCKAFQKFALKILNGKMEKTGNSLAHIVNVCYPEPINILELAEVVRKAIKRHTNNLVNPKIEIVDTGHPSLFDEKDKEKFKVNISKAKDLLGLNHLKSPDETIDEMVKNRIEKIVLKD